MILSGDATTLLFQWVNSQPNRHFTLSYRSNNLDSRYRVCIWEKREGFASGPVSEGFSIDFLEAVTNAIKNFDNHLDITPRVGTYWYSPVVRTWAGSEE